MPPPRSKVWKWFKRIDGVRAKCKYCLQEVRYCGNTSNLSKHLKKHPTGLDVPNVKPSSANAPFAGTTVQTKLKNTQK